MKIRFRAGITHGCWNIIPAIYGHYPCRRNHFRAYTIEAAWLIFGVAMAMCIKDGDRIDTSSDMVPGTRTIHKIYG